MNNGNQSHTTKNAVAALLPLRTLASLSDPDIYTDSLIEAVRQSETSLTIVFYQIAGLDISKLLSPQDDPSHWDVLQRFLGVVYGTAGQEGARLGRMVLDIRIFVEGLTRFSLSSRSYDVVLHMAPSDLGGSQLPCELEEAS
jgi:hypothetical protein